MATRCILVGSRGWLVGGDRGGSLSFIDKVKSELGFKAVHRDVTEAIGTYMLREESAAYAGAFPKKMMR